MKLPFLLAGLLAAGSALANDENVLTLGGGVAAVARYSGSDELQAAPIIAVDYQMANGFYASTLRGLGYGHDFGKLHLSAALGYRGERTDKEEISFGGRHGSDKLKGMGVVKGSGTGLFGAGYTIIEGLTISGHAEMPVTHRENGRSGGLSVTGTMLNTATDQVSLSVGANLADRNYAQTYYGVTAAQAARSGYKQYTPKGGWYEGVMSVAWQHRVDERWSVTGMLGFSTLLRDAKDSPITRKANTPSATVYASYKY